MKKPITPKELLGLLAISAVLITGVTAFVTTDLSNLGVDDAAKSSEPVADSATQGQVAAIRVGSGIHHIRDGRTGLCYAVIKNPSPSVNGSASITNVPCTSKVLDLIPTQAVRPGDKSPVQKFPAPERK